MKRPVVSVCVCNRQSTYRSCDRQIDHRATSPRTCAPASPSTPRCWPRYDTCLYLTYTDLYTDVLFFLRGRIDLPTLLQQQHHTKQHTQDGNDGLAQRVLDQHAVKGLQKLARTFQTLALDGAFASRRLASPACLVG